MSTRTMPMPENPTPWDHLQAALYPWLGTPEGWEAILEREDASREAEPS